MRTPPKCTIIKFHSTSSVGSALSFGHAALLCEGRFLIYGRIVTRVYLSVFGKNISCECGLGNNNETHYHNERHDEIIYKCDLRNETSSKFKKINLNHSSIDTDGIVEEILKIRQEVRSRSMGWDFQNNCSDLVLRALRKGIDFSNYSSPLYRDKFDILHTIISASIVLSGGNMGHGFRFMLRVFYFSFFLVKNKISINLFGDIADHFSSVLEENASISIGIRNILSEDIKSGKRIPDYIKKNRLGKLFEEKNIVLPSEYSLKMYSLVALESARLILDYNSSVNKSFKRMLYGSPYALVMTASYSSLLHRKTAVNLYSHLQIVSLSVLKVFALIISSAMTSYFGISVLPDTLKYIADLYDGADSITRNFYSYLFKNEVSKVLSFPPCFITISAPIFLLDYLVEGPNMMKKQKLLALSVTSVVLAMLVSVTTGSKSERYQGIVGSIVRTVESITPVVFCLLVSNYIQRMIWPNTALIVAEELKNNENTQEYYNSCSWVTRYLPSKSTFLWSSLKALTLFGAGYGFRRFKTVLNSCPPQNPS